VTTTTRASSPSRSDFDISGETSRPAAYAIKGAVQSAIRRAHHLLRQGPLESRLALYFHHLDTDHWGEFRQCMEYFKQRSYRSVDAPGFVAARPDDRCLFVSFDDNFHSWHEALPMLGSLNITATFYVNTLPFANEPRGAELYMRRLRLPSHLPTLTRAQLKDIRSAGHTIGCHSHSHYILSRLPPELWDAEIVGSKRQLEDIAGVPVSDFAWPYGMRHYFSEPLRQYCVGAGFKTIANAISGCQKIAGRDPLNIYRTEWKFGLSIAQNIANLRVDGRTYAALTGRSVIA